MNRDPMSRYWTQLSNYVKTNPVTNYSVQFLSSHRQKMVPAIVAIVFGGTILYVWRNGIRQRTLKIEKCEPSLQLDIIELPPEARRVIWSKLPYEDLLKLRLVSDFTKDDVDNLIGLKIIISSKHIERYQFSRTVALQSCTITHLTSEIGTKFFADPYLMHEIEIRERVSSISLTNLINILGPCINVTKLKLRFNYTSQITEISEIILNALHNMELLTHLEVMKIATQSIQEKTFPINTSAVSLSCPKFLKHLQLEMPDIADNQVGAWRYVMEQQTQLHTLIIHVGAVQWEYFDVVIPNNPKLEQVGLRSIKGYRIDSLEEKPFDWGIFANCTKLKCVELTCSRTSGERGEECMRSINFQLVPCWDIEEFHISRLILDPEDVQKIYREMPKLQRGSLDHIGANGTARATELSWLFHQQQEIERENWFTRERFWDAIFHTALGLSVMGVIIVASGSQPPPVGNELQTQADDRS